MRLLFACLLVLVGCNGSNGTTDATVAPCPATRPTAGAGCDRAMSCDYLDCAAAPDGGPGGNGAAHATCSGPGGTWSVDVSPCSDRTCYNAMCGANEICVVQSGGALIAHCEPNPCGTGPVGCDCAPCSVGACSTAGLQISCNTCTSGMCP